ncbi:family 43 glycosylhydrolase [Streptomyces sp. NPDC002643]
MIHNPVLRGFEPDPVILRVGDGFYIAASAFEWYPGMRIHHSRDLVNWRPDQESFAGIELQEYDRASGKLLLTSRHDPKLELRKAGHCSLVEAQDGRWYAANIAARPYGERGRCVPGRATALQPVA